MAKRIINNWGADLTIVESGLEAVELVKSMDFDLILMDIQMPIMDGYEATVQIRALQNEKKNIPILAMTASQTLGAPKCSKLKTFDGCIGKPFNPETLARAISKFSKVALIDFTQSVN